MDEEAAALLAFWFGPITDDDGKIAERQSGLWWSKCAKADREVAIRFGGLPTRAASGKLDHWQRDARGRLALIVALDQLPRQLFRDRAEAFAHDRRALDLSLQGQTLGQDRQLRPIERAFFYMPMEHAESEPIQKRCVSRFEALLAEVPPVQKPAFENLLAYARRHRDIIRRFGRFPHRNAILDRPSSAAEEAFLNEPGSRF